MISILLVEDDEKLSKLFYTVLSKQGFNIHIASNGIEGFDILENNHIDLIISDIMMPQMNGYDFTENVRKVNEEIPILMITAKDDFNSKQKSFLIGIDDYMVKPIDVNEMILRVHALLRRSKIAHDKKQVIGDTVLEYDSLSVTREKKYLRLISVTPLTHQSVCLNSSMQILMKSSRKKPVHYSRQCRRR